MFLLGGKSGNAYVSKIDTTNAKLWEKVIDLGKVELFFNGFPAEDGGVVVIGNSWNGDPFFTGSSNVVVIVFDKEGKILKQNIFLGRYSSIAGHNDGSFAIDYDKSDSESQNIWIKALNTDLKEKWNTSLFSVKRGAAWFKIAPISSGGFIVAGQKDFRLWVSKIDSEGKVLWNYWSDPKIVKRMASSFDLISLKDIFFILYSSYSEKEKQLFKKVGIIKFVQN